MIPPPSVPGAPAPWVVPPPPPPPSAPSYIGWPPLSPSPGDAALGALSEVRKGIRFYQLYLLVGLISSLAAGLLVSMSSGPVGLAIPPTPVAGAGWVPMLDLVATAGALAELALVIFAWVTWRGAIRGLPLAVGEYGPAASVGAHRALADYRRTVHAFLALVLTGVALALALVVAVFAALLGAIGTGASGAAVATPLPFTEVILIVLLAAVGVSAGLSFLMYFYASRSLVESLDPVATPAQREALASGRRRILLGAALSVVSFTVVLDPLFALLAVVPSVVLVLGFQRVADAYDAFLARPVRPPAFSSVAGP